MALISGSRRALYANQLSGLGDIESLADELVSSVRFTYTITNPTLASFFIPSNGRAAILGSYNQLGIDIDKWASTYRQWATDGHRDDGSAYDWGRWTDFSKDLTSASQAYIQYAQDANLVTAYASAVAKTVEDAGALVAAAGVGAAKLFNIFDWPWYVKIGAAGLGGYLLYRWIKR